MASSEKILTFTAAVREFHYYQKFWMPEENEKLDCSHERGNFYDRFAIKTTSGNGTTVGHLPKELSRVTMYLLYRGVTLSLELSSTNSGVHPCSKED